MLTAIAFTLLTTPAAAPELPFVAPGSKIEKLWSEGEFTEGPAEGPGQCNRKHTADGRRPSGRRIRQG